MGCVYVCALVVSAKLWGVRRSCVVLTRFRSQDPCVFRVSASRQVRWLVLPLIAKKQMIGKLSWPSPCQQELTFPLDIPRSPSGGTIQVCKSRPMQANPCITYQHPTRVARDILGCDLQESIATLRSRMLWAVPWSRSLLMDGPCCGCRTRALWRFMWDPRRRPCRVPWDDPGDGGDNDDDYPFGWRSGMEKVWMHFLFAWVTELANILWCGLFPFINQSASQHMDTNVINVGCLIITPPPKVLKTILFLRGGGVSIPIVNSWNPILDTIPCPLDKVRTWVFWQY